MSLQQKIRSPGPKKILALDGGGIRGVLTLAVLARLEKMFAEAPGKGPAFRHQTQERSETRLDRTP